MPVRAKTNEPKTRVTSCLRRSVDESGLLPSSFDFAPVLPLGGGGRSDVTWSISAASVEEGVLVGVEEADRN